MSAFGERLSIFHRVVKERVTSRSNCQTLIGKLADRYGNAVQRLCATASEFPARRDSVFEYLTLLWKSTACPRPVKQQHMISRSPCFPEQASFTTLPLRKHVNDFNVRCPPQSSKRSETKTIYFTQAIKSVNPRKKSFDPEPTAMAAEYRRKEKRVSSK